MSFICFCFFFWWAKRVALFGQPRTACGSFSMAAGPLPTPRRCFEWEGAAGPCHRGPQRRKLQLDSSQSSSKPSGGGGWWDLLWKVVGCISRQAPWSQSDNSKLVFWVISRQGSRSCDLNAVGVGKSPMINGHPQGVATAGQQKKISK